VLASHPLVDAKRLASTGQSGGGTLTMLLAAVDDRLAAAAVSCGNTENHACADFNPPGSVDDAEQNFVGGGPLGFDRWDLLYPLAPKPLLVTASARDFFGTYSPSYLTSGDEEFRKLQRIYALMDATDRVQWMDSPVPHALAPNMRVAIYNFFEKWLRGSDRTVAEPPVKPEPETALYVGATGNVVRDFGSTTPHRLAKARIAPRRTKPIQELLKVERSTAAATRLASTKWGEVTIDALEVPSAPGVFLPVWLYTPSPAAPMRPMLLMLEPQGRNARWREDDLYHRLSLAGFMVCAFDVRGIGDLSPEVGRGNPYYTRSHSDEEAYAWASMMLGPTLLEQRIQDILAMAGAMRHHKRPLVLAARDKMTVPALLAATLDKSLKTYLVNGIQSYAGLFESEDYNHPFANFLPNVLLTSDLPPFQPAPAWTYEAIVAANV
jgi:hypothetical protein